MLTLVATPKATFHIISSSNDGAIVSNSRKEWVPTEKREWNLE
jgi:hypothetical protein